MQVCLVQRVGYIEECYRVLQVEGLFRDRALAEKWIEREKAREASLRADRQRVNEIGKGWNIANPFVFHEVQPPAPTKWPSGMRKADITPEMRATREAQKKLEAEYYIRYGAAREAHISQLEAHIAAVWKAEGRTSDPTSLPPFHNEPTEYTITEMPVETSVDD